MNLDIIVQNIIDNWWQLALIPFVSAAVGYITNLMALKMMFKPMEFIGIPPYLGWQGIVPRKAAVMAGIAVDTMTTKLIKPEEIFERLDPHRVAAELEEPMRMMADDIVYDVMAEHQPTLWATLPDLAKQRVVKRVQRDSPALIAEIMDKVRYNLDEMFDVKDMVITSLMRDKELLNRIFLDVGEPEFKFIARSGAYFGFLFGMVQMIVYAVYPASWVLPFFGLLVGYGTNWIALKMIFEPKEPVRVGLIKIQGLFLKRQTEVASHYGELIASEILTPANIIEGVFKGAGSDRLFKVIEREVKRAVDESIGVTMPMIAMTVGTKNYRRMKASAIERLVDRLPSTVKHIGTYAEDAMDIRNTIVERMKLLTPTEFERLLRPAFEQDEWLLIAVGALLGMAAGFAQLVIMFGGG